MMALVGYFAGVFSDNLIQSGMTITLTRKIMQVCNININMNMNMNMKMNSYLIIFLSLFKDKI